MVHESENPLVKHLVNELREMRIDALRFRHLVRELTRLMLCETAENFPRHQRSIVTWQGKRAFDFIDQENLLFATVLRAGMPMLEAAGELFPLSPCGFLAMKRDEVTKESHLYYDRIPECRGKTVVLVDVMVATGGSLVDAVDVLKSKEPARILSVNVIGAPEGIEVMQRQHPDVDILIAQIDERLNAEKFILPGLGDAGDRSYNTVEKQ